MLGVCKWSHRCGILHNTPGHGWVASGGSQQARPRGGSGRLRAAGQPSHGRQAAADEPQPETANPSLTNHTGRSGRSGGGRGLPSGRGGGGGGGVSDRLRAPTRPRRSDPGPDATSRVHGPKTPPPRKLPQPARVQESPPGKRPRQLDDALGFPHGNPPRLDDPRGARVSPSPRPSPGPRIRDVRRLSDLTALLERHLSEWAANGSVGELEAAFSALAKLGAPPNAEPKELHIRTAQALTALAAAYLPLVPRLRVAKSCVIPLYACAKLGVWPDGLAAPLLRRLGGRAHNDGGSTAGATGPVSPPSSSSSLLLEGAGGQSHALLWWALSNAPPEVVDAAGGVLAASAACLLRMPPGDFTSQNCSNLLLACARLRWCAEPAVLHRLAAVLAAKHSAMEPQHLANGLYALGELAEDCGHRPRDEDLRGLQALILPRLRSQLERVRQHPAPAGDQAQQRQQPGTGRDGDGFVPQGLTNMLLGCAKLGYGAPPLPQLLAEVTAEELERAPLGAGGQPFANSLYALARLGCRGGVYRPAVERLGTEAVCRLRDRPEGFIPQHLSNLLLALEGLRPAEYRGHARALAAECRRRGFAGFKPQEMSNAAWALAKMDCCGDQDWFAEVVAAAMRPGAMAGAKTQAWVNLLYGLALVRHRPHEGLLRAMVAGQEAEQQQQPQGVVAALRVEGNAQECANVLWSLAVLDLRLPGMVDTVAQRLGELLQRDQQQVADQALSNSLWALAVMGPQVLARRHGGLAAGLLREAARRWAVVAVTGQGTAGTFTSEGLAQLWQVQQELEYAAGVWRDARGLELILLGSRGGAVGSCSPLASAAQQGARTQRLDSDPATSELQVQVLRALKRVARGQDSAAGGEGGGGGGGGGGQPADGRTPPVIASLTPECEVEALCCRVDVLVELADGRRVAVEVDGPVHFMANEPYRRMRTGRTRLRDRQLARVFGAGCAVSVPYWEWNELLSGREREEYLCRLLQGS